MPKSFDDLEFHVGEFGSKAAIVSAGTYESASKALEVAKDLAESFGRKTIDVVTWSKAAAKLWAGDHGAEEYTADPESSVHDRLVFRNAEWESTGRVA